MRGNRKIAATAAVNVWKRLPVNGTVGTAYFPVLYNAVAECSIEGIQPSHYHRRSVFTDFIHTLDGRCSWCISHCESIDFVYDTGVYTDMSFASSCRIGWLAISGGELGCHCTPEAFKTGKPRRAFFYRLPHPASSGTRLLAIIHYIINRALAS